MIKIDKLNPFGRLCVTLGMLPSSYKESLTYEEQLLWMLNYIEKTLIPTINNNAGAVEELQALYLELKSYVDSYFENLNVQQEINNKLDQMAESGQLTDIIAQYLGLAGILAYNTKNDMKNATNLTNGSICKTLGDDVYNDGKGNLYKIRTITSDDVVDNDNIIALSVSNTLIAEKIPNYYINKNTADINKNTTDINNINNNINNKEKGLIAISRNTTNNDHYLYYSEDGENFNRVGNKLSLTEDSSALILINDTYYYFGNNSYYYSDDLVTWSNGIMINDNAGRENWAFYPFYDPVSEKYLVFSALQYNDNTFTDKVGNTGYYFKIIKQEFTINNDKTLTFTTPTDFIYANNESYIDPAICYDEIHKYTIAVKRENGNTAAITLYNTSDLSNIGNPYATLDGVGSEACQLIDEDGFITMYCHDYALNSAAVTGLSGDMGQTYSKVIVANPTTIYNTANLTRHACKMPEIFRHAGIMKCDRKTLNLITSIGIKNTPLYICDDYGIIGDLLKQTFCNTAGATYNLPNLPYGLFILGGGSSIEQMNINVKKYYDTPLKLFLGPTNVKFGGDTTNTGTVTTDALYNDGIMIECPVLPNKYINLPFKW